MASANEDLWADVREKLNTVFDDDEEDLLVRFLVVLAEEERRFGNNASTWKTLKSAINKESLFKKLAHRFANEMRSTESDPTHPNPNLNPNLNLDPNLNPDANLSLNLNQSPDSGSDADVDDPNPNRNPNPDTNPGPDPLALLYEKLIAIFANNREDVLRVLFVLNEEETNFNNRTSPTRILLESVTHDDSLFKDAAQRIADNTRTAENDQRFRAAMPSLYENLQHYAEHLELATVRRSMSGAWLGFAHAWPVVPASIKATILNTLESIIGDPLTLRAFMFAGEVEIVPLAAVFLTLEALCSIYQWWNGEISGIRCVKDLVDSIASIGGGIGGGIGGAAIGGLLGPGGAIVGGILGGALGGFAGGSISSYLTHYLFGIPKDKALENAYNFLNVNMKSSNGDINVAYRRLCLKYHPDKGGSHDDFVKLQMCMAVIKMARGEIYRLVTATSSGPLRPISSVPNA